MAKTKKKIIVAISPHKSLRDSAGQAGKHKKRIAVAMSGGVDSAVALLMLKNQGHDVVGLFLRLTKNQATDEASARKICQKLQIKFYPINAYQKFNKNVIQYFCSAYKKGLTPNPCIECNKTIKFGELLKYLRIFKADYLATGHYIKLKKQSTIKLFRGKDKQKDQSYFLYNLKQRQLSRILFPLGDYTKTEVKKLAEKYQLPCAKAESQDICFLEGDHNNFLKKNIKLKKGLIKDPQGKILGEHFGLPLYTIGQRKGIELGGTGPFYVAQADYKTNTLFVTNDANHKKLFSSQLECNKVNWISGQAPKMPLTCTAKIRYGHQAEACTVNRRENKLVVNFKNKQRAVTPGQSVVFYKKDELLGGGIIL